MNIEWISKVIDNISKIGLTADNGSHRLGFSDADLEAREYFISLLKEADLDIRTDNFGNIFARTKGFPADAPVVATGSHIDTVPNGGHYDGIMGSVASLAAIKKIQADKTPLKHPLELIVFQLEESSRFGHATMGSKVIAGKDVYGVWKTAKDAKGNTLIDVLKQNGGDFDKLPDSKLPSTYFSSFTEIHIDQSQDLQRANLPVACVEAIAAPIRSKIIITGEAAHSGSTPMNRRKDALVSASHLVVSINDIANKYADQKIVATVGDVKVTPGAMNVVPAKAELFLDLRGIDKSVMEKVFAEIKQSAQGIADKYNTPAVFELLISDTPVVMDRSLRKIIQTACKKYTGKDTEFVSGAGHDAMNMATITPTGMIFIRCKDGVSHHPAEFASIEDIDYGFKVLTDVLTELAKK